MYEKEWRQKNPDRARAKVRNYQARKQQAMPRWADVDSIYKVYANCPKGFEVDHIIPLKGKNVCGLHIAANLQYLSVFSNRSKANKF